MPTPTGPLVAEHVAAFHVSDTFIITQAAAFIAAGLRAGERVIALATQEHWNAIAKELEDSQVALGRATAEGRLVLIEADQLVDTLTVAGQVDANAFRATLQPLMKPGIKLRVYGEVVSLLAARGDVDGALAIEQLGHELTQTLEVGVLCGYHLAGACPLRTSDIGRIQELHGRSLFEQPTHSGTAAGRAHKAPAPRELHDLHTRVPRAIGDGASRAS